jgi:hypothetical protein
MTSGELFEISERVTHGLKLAQPRAAPEFALTEPSGAIGIALRRWRRQTEATDFGQPTAATTRLRVSALPSTPLPVPGVGRPRWLVELIRCRAGERAQISNWRRAMTRVISAFLPTLSTDRVRRKAGAMAPPAETPLILVGRDGRRRVVLAADAAAQAAGLQRFRLGPLATPGRPLSSQKAQRSRSVQRRCLIAPVAQKNL